MEQVKFYWVAVEDTALELPIYVAESSKELGAILGITSSAVRKWTTYINNEDRRKKYKIYKIALDGED